MRGATTFGPAPTLDIPLASIDVGDADDGNLRLLGLHAYEQGRTPDPSAAHAIPEATLTARARVMRSPLRGIVLRGSPQERGSPGVRHLLERPPRTV
ncbi:hypothetical protein [Pendulispora albinea]|uniref:Uncharacterized protein n=1 Tax=Pendulispora albinea TaxID=2741071 RepID=A0ABZ2M2N4_9BACT